MCDPTWNSSAFASCSIDLACQRNQLLKLCRLAVRDLRIASEMLHGERRKDAPEISTIAENVRDYSRGIAKAVGA